MKRLLVFLFVAITFLGCKDKLSNRPNYPSSKKVLVIGLDGCRSDVLTEELAPFMNGLLNKNTVAYNLEHKAEDITVSGPNWTSICTGVHYEKHGVRENVFMNNRIDEYPHFFQHLNDYYGEDQVNLLSVTTWFPINYFMAMLIADYSPVKFNYTDEEVFEESAEILRGDGYLDPDVLFVHIDQLDHAGHAYGYHPDTIKYQMAVSKVDAWVASYYDIVEQRRQDLGEDWLVVIVSDHGGLGYGHDGGADIPEIRNTIVILDNPSISNSGQLDQSEQVDVVPTVLKFLEVELVGIDLDGSPLL